MQILRKYESWIMENPQRNYYLDFYIAILHIVFKTL